MGFDEKNPRLPAERRPETGRRAPLLLLGSLASTLAFWLLSCTNNPQPAVPEKKKTSSNVSTYEEQKNISASATSVSVIFKQADFYTITDTNYSGCPGDAKVYYRAWDYQAPENTAGATGPTGRVAYPKSVVDPTTTIKPDFIRNISVDITDANYAAPESGPPLAGTYPAAMGVTGAVNRAFSGCSYGSGSATIKSSNCATFDTYTTSSVGGLGSWRAAETYSAATADPSGATAVGADTKGGIYVTGYRPNGLGVKNWTVRRTLDAGKVKADGSWEDSATWTWTGLDSWTYNGPAAVHTFANGIAVSADGTAITVIGYGVDATKGNTWLLRRSVDSGASWGDPNSGSASTASLAYDKFNYKSAGFNSGDSTIPKGIVIDSHGWIHVVGYAIDATLPSPGNSRWLYRRSKDGGATWTTVPAGNFQYSGGGGLAYGLAIDSKDHLYAVGDQAVAPKTRWIVRKSTDGGDTWTSGPNVVPTGAGDDFVYKDGSNNDYDSSARAVAVDPQTGTIWVAGTVVYGGQTYWLVRKSTDAGVTWYTAGDPYQLVAGKNSTPTAIGVDLASAVYVAGIAFDGSTPSRSHAIIRKSKDGGQLWTKVDDFDNTGQEATAGGLGRDNTGHLYMAGTQTTTATGKIDWILRQSLVGPGGGYYNPLSYTAGYYTLLDYACPGVGPVASSDSEVSKQNAGGIYIDLNRDVIPKGENLLLSLTYLPLGPANKRPNGTFFAASEATNFKIHLVKTGHTAQTLQALPQPRHLTYADTESFKHVAPGLGVIANPTGQFRQDQFFIPLAAYPGADRIRVERITGSAIMIEASVFRLGPR